MYSSSENQLFLSGESRNLPNMGTDPSQIQLRMCLSLTLGYTTPGSGVTRVSVFAFFSSKVAWNFILVLYVFLNEPFKSILIDMVCKTNVLVRNCMHYNSHRSCPRSRADNVFATKTLRFSLRFPMRLFFSLRISMRISVRSCPR